MRTSCWPWPKKRFLPANNLKRNSARHVLWRCYPKVRRAGGARKTFKTWQRTLRISGCSKALCINCAFTTHIEGLKKNESGAILNMLYAHIDTPEFHCRFDWSGNSVAFWDNRCTQHFAAADYFPQHRRMQRVTVVGDRPV